MSFNFGTLDAEVILIAVIVFGIIVVWHYAEKHITKKKQSENDNVPRQYPRGTTNDTQQSKGDSQSRLDKKHN